MKRSMQCRIVFGVMMCAVMCAMGGRTSMLVENSYDRWIKGEATRVMIEPEGVLQLAPEIISTGLFAVPMLDAVLACDDGCVYASSAGKVYLRHPDGSNEVVVAFEQEKVTALAQDAHGTLYLGVSPGGVIYRRDAGGVMVRAADTGQRYIWALRAQPDGSLLAATGHKGILQQITFSGTAARITTLLDSTEDNITALAELGGVVYAGTSPRGYVYRIEGTNQPFLLLDTRANEATSLLVETNGVVWVTTMGSAAAAAPAAPSPAVAAALMAAMTSAATGAPAGPVAPAPPAGLPAAASRLFRIAPDGFSEVYWQSSEPVLYALAQRADGTMYVGSGNKGRLFVVRGRGRAALAAQLPARQIMALQALAGGTVHVVCTEPASQFVLGAVNAVSGRYESAVVQVADVVRWGRIELDTTQAALVRVVTRSGNNDTPDTSWSAWRAVETDGRIASPAARMLQYALELRSEGSVSPLVRAVKLFYAEPNRAPVIDVIAVSPAHTELIAPPVPPAQQPGGGNVAQLIQEWLSAAGVPALAASAGPPPGAPQAGAGVMRLNSFGARTIAWLAQDPNGDALSARVWISRASDRPEWIPLVKERKQNFVTFNTREWEDGRYCVRVLVSDDGAAPGGEALAAERISDTFVIDNTPPVIEAIVLTRTGDRLRVQCRVRDALSTVSSLQYAIDTREARSFVPVDGVFDAVTEEFDVSIPVPAKAGWLRLIASDENKNTSGAVRAIPAAHGN